MHEEWWDTRDLGSKRDQGLSKKVTLKMRPEKPVGYR